MALVNRPWFRAMHLAAIVFVAIESWIGIACPLTTLESWLRSQAGATPYAGSFIGHWVQGALFYDAPPRVFTAVYTLFGLVVVAVWRCYPPRRR